MERSENKMKGWEGKDEKKRNKRKSYEIKRKFKDECIKKHKEIK